MIANIQKDIIVQRLKGRGCRITKQRLMLLDIILEGNCSSCKEILYKASKRDKNIGAATVYRMINTLEEIGALQRGNLYHIISDEAGDAAGGCQVELEDGSRIRLTADMWREVMQEGLYRFPEDTEHCGCA